MIDLNELKKLIDEVVDENNGVCYGGRIFYGDFTLSFINGWPKDKYKVSVSEVGGKNPRLNKAGGSADALDRK